PGAGAPAPQRRAAAPRTRDPARVRQHVQCDGYVRAASHPRQRGGACGRPGGGDGVRPWSDGRERDAHRAHPRSMIPDLSERATGARELMDEPDADRAMLDRTYALFPLVNAVVSGWRDVYRRDIRPLARRRSLRVLDIGAGGGDLTRMIARRLRHD